ncbi:MAG: hypothetical protein IIW73_01915 [Clostridia bacterium]|nr:hypothetical protein [Clostridia bacterium]
MSNKFFKSLGKFVFLTLIAFKIVASALIFIRPETFMDNLYPFGIFSPFMLCAVAYTDISPWLMATLLLIACILVLSLPIFCILLVVNKRGSKISLNSITGFFVVEAMCFLASFLFGDYSFGKVLGIVINLMLILVLRKSFKNDD